MKDIAGANAILTGASRGLGVLIARALADEGVNLVLAARSAPQLEKVRSEIEAKGVRAIAVPTDVTDAAQREALVATAEGELGQIDILVNNAGIEATYEFDIYPPDELQQLMDINLIAPMLLTRAVLPGMLARNRGHIVHMASLAGKGGFPCQAPYAASKAGLVMFSHTLRAELVDSAVGSSAVCPGFVADEGMYADMVKQTGVQASRLLGVSKPEKCAEAVVKAIKQDASELIVNPTPMRPLLTMSQMFPDTSSWVMKALGVTALARRIAATQPGAAHPGEPKS